jgi:hypothetical protein
MYFANPSTPAIRAHMAAGRIGWIATPGQGNALPPGMAWCGDNGAYTDAFNEADWWTFLTRNAGAAATCAFAVAPDVVGDAAATLTRSLPWLPRIRALGYPAAFVAQDGAEHTDVPWGEFDCLFIGGSTEFKLGHTARQLVGVANRRGLHTHCGRVNSLRRLRYAEAIGCDSADGTYLTFGPDVNLPKLLGWVRELHEQPPLFGMEQGA